MDLRFENTLVIINNLDLSDSSFYYALQYKMRLEHKPPSLFYSFCIPACGIIYGNCIILRLINSILYFIKKVGARNVQGLEIKLYESEIKKWFHISYDPLRNKYDLIRDTS